MNAVSRFTLQSVTAILGLVAGLMFNVALAGDITPKMQLKIDVYKKQAAIWASDPMIIQAAK